MSRVFLSHSSKDKERMVRSVATKLQNKFDHYSIFYDEYTFEEGLESIELIINSLEKTDLFVIFISQHSLESPWVIEEMEIACELLNDNKVQRVYPILIDDNISFDDDIVPEFLKKYNLKYVSKSSKATSLIQKRMIEINWDLHPRIKEKNNIFVGRNALVHDFEMRRYDRTKKAVNIYIANGIDRIGRSSLLRYCLKKSHIIDASYYPSQIYLNDSESIEDFILNIHSLGYNDDDKTILNLMNKSIDEKVAIAEILIRQLVEHNEVVFIKDYGCIVTSEGKLAAWFKKIAIKVQDINKVIFGISSKFRLTESIFRIENLDVLSVPELSKVERSGLLDMVLRFEKINISQDDFKNYLDFQLGFPEQVYFTVDLIKEYGVEGGYDYSSDIIEYSIERVTNIMLEVDKEDMDFLVFLAEIDVVSYSMLIEIIDDVEFVRKKIKDYLIQGIVEYAGVDKEFIKLNTSVKNYITRLNIKVTDDYNDKMNSRLKVFVNSHEYEELEIPDLHLMIKESIIKKESVDMTYAVPSHYLKVIIELYEKSKDYLGVINFADYLLEYSTNIDVKLEEEILTFLCRALARTRNPRFFDVVQGIKGTKHPYLKSFYYRLTGNYKKALIEIEKALYESPNYASAKRELVTILLGLHEYEEARKTAKDLYESNPSNSYHIHSYFTCVIRDEKSETNRMILKELIERLKKISSEKSDEIRIRLYSLYEAFYNNDKPKSLALIDEAIGLSEYKLYAILDKYEICEHFGLVDAMEKIVHELERDKKIYGGNRFNETIVRLKSVLIAKRDGCDEAREYVAKEARRSQYLIPDKLLARIDRIEKYNISCS